MFYRVVLKQDAHRELDVLPHTQKILVFKQLKKLSNSPQLGVDLGNKAGIDLSGHKKMYVDKKKIRIVYRIIESEVIVEVIAIGKRENRKVYEEANKRKS